MLPLAYFIHLIDPVLLEIGALRLWYYGLAYSLGFLGTYVWLRGSRRRLGWHGPEALELALLFAGGILLFGRAFEVAFYEWEYYARHPAELLSYWRGGMASHGVLVGAVVGIWLFCRRRRLPFFRIADEVVIPGALFLALGRIGNFINGQIYGSVTDVWWAVLFPGQDDPRHPVTLYESLKNLAILPVLICLRRRAANRTGVVAAHFLFWYALLRLFTDHFRDYATTLWGIGTGQYLNALTAACGAGLILWRSRIAERPPLRMTAQADHERGATATPEGIAAPRIHSLTDWLKAILFVALLLFSLTIPSSWTQGVLDELRSRSPHVGGAADTRSPPVAEYHADTATRALAPTSHAGQPRRSPSLSGAGT